VKPRLPLATLRLPIRPAVDAPRLKVRHPLYSAVMALWLGAALGTLNWLLLALSPLGVAALFMSTCAEEGLLRARFGTNTKPTRRGRVG
jgi:hypothetical protein